MSGVRVNVEKYELAAAHPQVRRRIDRRSERVSGGCVIWQGARNTAGYGTMTIGGVSVYVHRLAYIVRVGQIPAGMVVDHLCHQPACVNVEHLTLTTMPENSARSILSMTRKCPSGHDYSTENTRIWTDKLGRPHRYCITCTNTRNAARYPTKKSA